MIFFVFSFTFLCFRAIHIATTLPENSGPKQTEFIKALKSVRVLRPLKLVSGVPSECHFVLNNDAIN